MDACTVILLAKASVLESAAKAYAISIPESVYNEVLAGKDKKLVDALLTERLIEERILTLAATENPKLRDALMQDFSMGIGEADTFALSIEKGFDAVATDNKQGRKAALVNSLKLIGSPEIVMALFKTKEIPKDKTKKALKVLKNEGWFNELLIERLMEEVEKND